MIWRLRRRIHVSWLLAIAGVSVVLGVALAQWVNGWSGIAWLLLSLVMIGLVLWRRSLYLLPLLVTAGLIVGLWRGSLMQSELTPYQQLYGVKLTITGSVSDDPDLGKKGETVLRLNGLIADNHSLAGSLWVTAHTTADIKRGDRVAVQGKIGQGFGSFAGTMYQAKVVSVQRPEPGDVARQVRDWFADSVRLGIDDPQASLGLGYLLGQRRALPPELTQALVVTGLTHVVVASGYNLTILVRLARRLFAKVSKYLSLLAASTMILAFIAVTGASPSMVRAGLVSGLSLLAWYYGRKMHPLVLLAVAASVTVLINPAYAWNDLGWQLSFAAFGGVMIIAPLLQAYFFGARKPGFVRQLLGETIAASIATLPILVLAFGQFSNVAVFANLLVLPLVPLAMLLTFVTGIGGLVVPDLAQMIGLPAQLILDYTTTVVQYLAGLPWAVSELRVTVWHIVVAYILIIGACIAMQRVTKYRLRDSNITE